MTKEEVLKFINDNQACHLATFDGVTPHVRGMMIYRADEEGIIFHTGKFKDVYNQLLHNPNVEFCFNNFQSAVQVRVTGTAEAKENIALKEEIVGKRPFMKPWVEKEGFEQLAVFVMRYDKATKWTLETNFSPKKFISL